MERRALRMPSLILVLLGPVLLAFSGCAAHHDDNGPGVQRQDDHQDDYNNDHQDDHHDASNDDHGDNNNDPGRY